MGLKSFIFKCEQRRLSTIREDVLNIGRLDVVKFLILDLYSTAVVLVVSWGLVLSLEGISIK